MKKIALMAALMMALTVEAQYEPGKWSLQPRVGFTVSSLTNMDNLPLSTNQSLDKSVVIGSIAGVDVEYQIHKIFSLSAGINFSMQGQGWKDFKGTFMRETVEMKDTKIETYYFNIPILANFYVYKGLAVKAGVQFGFLTNADFKFMVEGKEDIGGNSRDVKSHNSINIKDDFKTVDVSIPIGVSYELNSHWVFDARYNIGLTKVNKESLESGKDYKNGCFQLTFGYKCGL